MSHAATWTARAVALVALVALASLLAACHTTRVVWAKSGGDTTALQSDMEACGYHSPATGTAYQPAPALPVYQPAPTASGYPANPMAPAHATGNTKSVTIDVPDEQRSPVRCMIAHGWRLTPLP